MFSRAMKSAARKADRFYSCKSAAPRILVLGSEGQIGSELVQILRQRHGVDNVIASDVRKPSKDTYKAGPFQYVDVCNSTQIAKAIVDNGIDWVVHNVSIMSVAGENNPNRALDINMQGTRNVLDLCREHKLRVLIPSTIAVFGPDAGKDNVPENVILNPTTVYGITKVFMEHLGNYYHRRFGVDFRCLRYPGILSYITLPGGGTTDYAIDIFHQALRHGKYTCPIERNEPLPMMYMPDCLDATVKLLEAPAAGLSRRVYNVGAVSFTPEQLANEVKKHIPFEIDYKINPTFQGIASSWPNSIDDSAARRDWGWSPSVDLAAMVKHMAENIQREYFSDRTTAKH